MTLEHGLRRNPDNEPVCACGYRPEILDSIAPVGKQCKAKTSVLNHAEALNEKADCSGSDVVRFAEEALGLELTPWQEALLRRLYAPFVVTDRTRFPRAGVRPLPSGEWKLTLWDEPDVMHAWEDPRDAIHPDRYTACVTGQLIIGAHRQAGTRLNGLGR